MTSVKSVLHRHLMSDSPPALGGGGVRTRNNARQALANDLVAVSHRNRMYFAICFAAVLVVLAGAGLITVRYLDSPSTIRTIFGVLGISITALTVQLTSLWKQKVSADLLVVLARNVDESQLKGLLDTLVSRL